MISQFKESQNNFDILYFGGIFGDCFEKHYNLYPFNIAQKNLEIEIIDGLYKNKDIEFNVFDINTLPIFEFNQRKKIFRKSTEFNIEKKIISRTYSTIRIPIIKQLEEVFETFERVIHFNVASKNRRKIIFIAVNYLPVALPVLLFKKIFKYKVIWLATDIAVDTFSKERILERNFNKVKKFFLKGYKNCVDFSEKHYDGYIVLTQSINQAINNKNKKYTVIEGICSSNFFKENNFKKEIQKKERKILIYAGSFFKNYGINKILEVFEYIDDLNIELHFYGKGECVNEIIKAQNKDTRIKYFGMVPSLTLFSRLQEADLILNLRDPSLSYTKYSFPSKMFESLASGTPLLTTQLEGIPKEYYEYVFSVNTYNSYDISQKIQSILNLNYSERESFGERAKKFVKEEKTQKAQIKRIVELLYSLFE